MKKRTFESETEYGLHIIDADGNPITASTENNVHDELEIPHREVLDEFLQYSFLPILEEQFGIISESSFRHHLDNGSDIHADQLRSFIWRTPEATSPKEIVFYEKAADQLVYSALKKLKERDELEFFQANRRSSDSTGNLWGYHENITSDQEGLYESDEFVNFLASYNAMRNIFAGAGAVLGEDFVVSPRAAGINEIINETSHMSIKPLIRSFVSENRKNSNSLTYQFVATEAANNPEIVFIRHALNEVVVMMYENGICFEDLILRDPVRAANKIAYDTELVESYQLENGDTISAQGWILKFVDSVQATPQILENCSNDVLVALNLLRDKALNCKRKDVMEWQKRKIRVESRAPSKHDINKRTTADLTWDIIHPQGTMYSVRNTLIAQLVEIDEIAVDQIVDEMMLMPGEHETAQRRSAMLRNGARIYDRNRYFVGLDELAKI